MVRSKRTSLLGPAAVAACAAAAALLGLGAPAHASTAARKVACKAPKRTVVSVKMFEFGFTLAPHTAIHCGTVVFKMKNTGSIQHNFDLQGVKVGPMLAPGESATMVVKVAPRRYSYLCDVLGHAQQGMAGTLVVKK